MINLSLDRHDFVMPQNKYVEIGKEKWWTDFSIYDDESLL